MADTKVGFNVNSFIEGSDEYKEHSVEDDRSKDSSSTKKRSSTRKKNTEMVPAETAPTPAPVPVSSMSYIQDKIPYQVAYQETNAQLDESINQLNLLGGELFQELQSVRASKTLRNRFNLINDMTMTASSIISAKLSAIKEKNDTIGNVAKLELQRMKDLKAQASAEDDTTRIANLYDAFINTPVGVGPAGLGPNMQDMIMAGNTGGLAYADIGGTNMGGWEQSLDPAQNRMVLEAKGVIETVVMFDAATGNRWFEVIDKNTRQPVPGVEKPDGTFIDSLDLNIRGGYAKDSNRNAVYPLIVLNQDQMHEF